MPTLVYKYGLRRPTANAKLVDEQMLLAHRYYNRLIEIERTRREEVEAVLSSHIDVAPLETVALGASLAVEGAIAEVKSARARTRSRSETADMRAKIKALKEVRRDAWSVVKEAKKILRKDAAIQAAISSLNETAKTQAREARGICGVFWGTYLIVEAAVDAARKDARVMPHFHRWGGEGTVAVQVQGGLRSLNAMGCADTRLQLDIPAQGNGTAKDHASKRSRKRKFGTLRLRVGSEGRAPIWAEWPLLMHRPLPASAQIMWAKVKRERIADRDVWSLHLTLRLPDGHQKEECGSGVVACDIGWRQLEDGNVRAGYLIDDLREEQELVLDPGVLSGLRKVEDLRSIRDKAQNKMSAQLYPWLKSQPVPPWMAEAMQYMHAWKSPRRWVNLCAAWAQARWPGDEVGFGLVDAWAKQDLHLWRWEAHQRRKSLRRRMDRYRVFAASLARRYSTLVLENFDLRKVSRNVAPESTEVELPTARLHQRDAATSELRTCLIQAFASRGGSIVKINPSLTTQRCSLCGYGEGEGERWDPIPQVEHTCVGCGAAWDQDANACHNLMRLYREGSGDDATPDTKRQAKWGRLGRHAGSARKEDPGSAESQDICE